MPATHRHGPPSHSRRLRRAQSPAHHLPFNCAVGCRHPCAQSPQVSSSKRVCTDAMVKALQQEIHKRGRRNPEITGAAGAATSGGDEARPLASLACGLCGRRWLLAPGGCAARIDRGGKSPNAPNSSLAFPAPPATYTRPDLVISEPLGQGGFGKVYKGTWHRRMAAIKVRRGPKSARGRGPGACVLSSQRPASYAVGTLADWTVWV